MTAGPGEETGPVCPTVALLLPRLDQTVATEGRAGPDQAPGPRLGLEDGRDGLPGAGRHQLVVVFPPVVGVFRHEEPPLLTSVGWGALRLLLLVRVVLGSKCVHQLVDEVEDGHPQRDPALLERLHADKQTVEAVRFPVNTVSKSIVETG